MFAVLAETDWVDPWQGLSVILDVLKEKKKKVN